jgi:ABC-type Fe3+/spermidine/putrescine transport system ATPase subunit
VLLRPEAIQLERVGAGPDQNGATMRGQVTDVRFIGSIVHYSIATRERTIVASRPPESTRLFSEGEDITVNWEPDDVLILKN